jgi:hypothetical protein
MKKKLTALEILTEAYGDPPKLITPTVLSRVLVCDGIAAELSEGKGPRGGRRFAVQIAVSLGSGRPLRVHPMPLTQTVQSALFRTRAAAERHIAAMQEHLRTTSPEGVVKCVPLSMWDRWTIDSEEGLGWVPVEKREKRVPRGKSKT